jgi:predicted Rossmann fold flavoprotein
VEKQADVIIIGAGAAGLTTAIWLGRARPGTAIALLDGSRKIGLKILVSGGGRCNVTNVRIGPADYFGGNRNVLRRVLAAFPAAAARGFFEEIGVPLHEEEFGKLYPDSNTARTVVAALMAEAERVGACVHTGHRVVSIQPAGGEPAPGTTTADRAPGRAGGDAAVPSVSASASASVAPSASSVEGFAVVVQKAESVETWHARAVVLATGGRSLPKTGSDGAGYEIAQQLGHSIVPTTPALDPLLLEGGLHAELSGISQDVELTVRTAGNKPVRLAGPMLWTHFGVSGPAALDVSRFWHRAQVEARDVSITASFTAGQDFAAVERTLLTAAQEHPRAQVATSLRGWLPGRVAEGLCRQLEVEPDLEIGRLTRDARRRLVHGLTAWPMPIVGTRGYNYAEVTAGGIPVSEVDPSTMASRLQPGLHLVGEILDVDGRLGGFNFQWAWSSGFVAGTALARWL